MDYSHHISNISFFFIFYVCWRSQKFIKNIMCCCQFIAINISHNRDTVATSIKVTNLITKVALKYVPCFFIDHRISIRLNLKLKISQKYKSFFVYMVDNGFSTTFIYDNHQSRIQSVFWKSWLVLNVNSCEIKVNKFIIVKFLLNYKFTEIQPLWILRRQKKQSAVLLSKKNQ